MMAKANRGVSELSTSEAREELEEIVRYFEQPSADLDQLVAKLERATELATELDQRITATRLKVEALTPKLMSLAVDPETGEIVEP
jgi:exodeoxyribonuclease VII small subunit